MGTTINYPIIGEMINQKDGKMKEFFTGTYFQKANNSQYSPNDDILLYTDAESISIYEVRKIFEEIEHKQYEAVSIIRNLNSISISKVYKDYIQILKKIQRSINENNNKKQEVNTNDVEYLKRLKLR